MKKIPFTLLRHLLPIAALFFGAASVPAGVAASSPIEEKKLDAKASLSLLDAHIATLEDRCEKLPPGPERDATQLRVKSFKERRGELAGDFRQSRFDALMEDVKTEWKKIVRSRVILS